MDSPFVNRYFVCLYFALYRVFVFVGGSGLLNSK